MLIDDCQRVRGAVLLASGLGMSAKVTTVLVPFAGVAGAVAGAVGDAVPPPRGAPV